MNGTVTDEECLCVFTCFSAFKHNACSTGETQSYYEDHRINSSLSDPYHGDETEKNKDDDEYNVGFTLESQDKMLGEEYDDYEFNFCNEMMEIKKEDPWCFLEKYHVHEKFCHEHASEINSTENDALSDESSLIADRHLIVYLWILGILALTGNGVVFATTLSRTNKNFAAFSDVEKIHNVTILNLAAADFLMGVYLLSLSITSTVYRYDYSDEKRYQWLLNPTCTALGITNTVSSQVSLTLLVLITFFRLRSVINPFKEAHLIPAVFAIFMIWMLWLLLATIPIFQIDRIKIMFDRFVVLENMIDFNGVHSHNSSCGICTKTMNKTGPGHAGQENDDGPDTHWSASRFEELSYAKLLSDVKFANNIYDTACNHSRFYFSDHPSWSELLNISERLHITDFSEHVGFIGYYNSHGLCTMKYFVDLELDGLSTYFTLSVAFYDTAACLFIAFSYIVIYLKTTAKSCCNFRECSNGLCIDEANGNVPASNQENDDAKLYRVVTIIVVTDVCCWVPITCSVLWYYIVSSRLDMDDSIDFFHSHKYHLTVFILIALPLNSLLNPFLQSARLRAICWLVVNKLRSVVRV